MLMFLLTVIMALLWISVPCLCFLFSDSIGLVTETKKALSQQSELDSCSKLEDNF